MRQRRCPVLRPEKNNEPCDRLLARSDGPIEVRCRHCKVVVVFDDKEPAKVA